MMVKRVAVGPGRKADAIHVKRVSFGLFGNSKVLKPESTLLFCSPTYGVPLSTKSPTCSPVTAGLPNKALPGRALPLRFVCARVFPQRLGLANFHLQEQQALRQPVQLLQQHSKPPVKLLQAVTPSPSHPPFPPLSNTLEMATSAQSSDRADVYLRPYILIFRAARTPISLLLARLRMGRAGGTAARHLVASSFRIRRVISWRSRSFSRRDTLYHNPLVC